MKNLFKTGQAMYLAALIELAIYNFFKGDFAMTRPKALPETLQFLNPAIAYLSGVLLILSAAAVCLNRYRKQGVFTIAVIIFLLATTRHFFLNLWADPINGYKSLWLISGALLLLTTLPGYKQYTKNILLANRVILCLFFVQCGLAHFAYTDFVNTLIPDYIPFHTFFTYFAGVCMIVGGFGLLIPATRRLVLLLLAIQTAGWFVLLHIPRAIKLSGDEWIGVGESLAVSGICLMIYGLLKSETNSAIIEKK